MIILEIINYILSGEKDKHRNFLDILKNEKNNLVKIINDIKEFDKNLEDYIGNFGHLKYEVDIYPRIQTKFSNGTNIIICSRKCFLLE